MLEKTHNPPSTDQFYYCPVIIHRQLLIAIF
jgi:hypothetical protein